MFERKRHVPKLACGFLPMSKLTVSIPLAFLMAVGFRMSSVTSCPHADHRRDEGDE